MIPSEGGLISTFGGQMILALVWLLVGVVIFCKGLLWAKLVFAAVVVTNDADNRAGRRLGRATWIWAAVTVAPPIIFAAIDSLIHVGHWVMVTVLVPFWWVGPIIVAAGVGAWAWRLQKRQPQQRQDFPEAPQPVTVVEPAVGWSLPDGVGQWDART